MAAASDEGPIIVVSDLHGQKDLLPLALRRGIALAGRADLDAVLLGDYVDNGPQVPELLEYLSSGQISRDFPHLRLHMILGNHDLACLLSLDPHAFGHSGELSRGKTWWQRWTGGFQDPDGGRTTEQYHARTQAQFVAKFPAAHRAFLEQRPWCVSLAQYVFVHAGLADQVPLDAQLEWLARRDLSGLRESGFDTYTKGGSYGMPDQICNKDFEYNNQPAHGVVVVTGHNKYPTNTHFVASHRIGMHSCACRIHRQPTQPLNCALLPRGVAYLDTTETLAPRFYSVYLKDLKEEKAEAERMRKEREEQEETKRRGE